MPVSFDSLSFRKSLGEFATGVTVVSLRTGQGVHGMTANSFTSVSLDPPLILVCIDKRNRTHALVAEAKRFAVNILAADQEDVACRYAGQEVQAEPIWILDRAASPVLEGALAWFDCTLVHSYDGGDHTIYVGRVDAFDRRGGRPLLFFRGQFTTLPDQGA